MRVALLPILLILGSTMLTCRGESRGGTEGLIALNCGHPAAGSRGLCVIRADGSKALTIYTGGLGGFSWSPDGTEIVFNAFDGHIWIVRADGSSEPRAIAKSPSARQSLQSPTWSPDGSRIAFAAGEELWLISPDGSDEQRLRVSVSGGTPLSWSPDGSKIAFSCGRHVCTIRQDGTDLRRLAQDLEVCCFEAPFWFPDGERIGFVDRAVDIYVMKADGSERRNLTTGESPLAGNPALSPDGSRIAFSDNLRIYVMNADGSGLKRLAEGELYGDPSWSPDGKRVVFVCDHFSANNICVVGADGSGLRHLPVAGTKPAWSPVR